MILPQLQQIIFKLYCPIHQQLHRNFTILRKRLYASISHHQNPFNISGQKPKKNWFKKTVVIFTNTGRGSHRYVRRIYVWSHLLAIPFLITAWNTYLVGFPFLTPEQWAARVTKQFYNSSSFNEENTNFDSVMDDPSNQSMIINDNDHQGKDEKDTTGNKKLISIKPKKSSYLQSEPAFITVLHKYRVIVAAFCALAGLIALSYGTFLPRLYIRKLTILAGGNNLIVETYGHFLTPKELVIPVNFFSIRKFSAEGKTKYGFTTIKIRHHGPLKYLLDDRVGTIHDHKLFNYIVSVRS